MKSSKTMYALAKAKAFEHGIQTIETPDNIQIYGYIIKMSDIRKIYTTEGFTSKSIPERHVKLWLSAGLIKLYYSGQVVAIVPDASDYEQIQDLIYCRKECNDASSIFILPAEASA